jgi:prepilin-type N-terminal cleavage/methylation domain-containing protein
MKPIFSRSRKYETEGFTLIELLVVMGIIVLMMALVAPAFNAIKGGQDVTSTTYNIAGILEQARAYAMANNTHVYVGFQEVNVNNASTLSPQVAGTGRIAVAVVASKSGTSITGSTYGTGAALLTPVSPLQHFENMHMAGTALTSSGNMARPPVSASYQLGNSSFPSVTPFYWPIGSASGSAQYSFAQVIEFDPQGTAFPSGATTMVQYMELGLQQTHGTAVSAISNGAAVQIDGMTGSTRIYRP